MGETIVLILFAGGFVMFAIAVMTAMLVCFQRDRNRRQLMAPRTPMQVDRHPSSSVHLTGLERSLPAKKSKEVFVIPDCAIPVRAPVEFLDAPRPKAPAGARPKASKEPEIIIGAPWLPDEELAHASGFPSPTANDIVEHPIGKAGVLKSASPPRHRPAEFDEEASPDDEEDPAALVHAHFRAAMSSPTYANSLATGTVRVGTVSGLQMGLR